MAKFDIGAADLLRGRAGLAAATAEMVDADGLISAQTMIALIVVAIRAAADSYDLDVADLARKAFRAVDVEMDCERRGVEAAVAGGVSVLTLVPAKE